MNNSSEITSKEPPYDKGILATLRWGLDTNIPLQEIPSEKNWCQSGYKCYYAGVIPGHFKAQESATNFVMSSMNNVTIDQNPSKPATTKLVTDSFFIMLVDIRDAENIKSHFFFYDGSEAVKNFRKSKLPLKEFTLHDVGQYRRPWQKINVAQMEKTIKMLDEMFKEFTEKVKSQQLENEKTHQHEDHCECCENHDAAEPAGHK